MGDARHGAHGDRGAGAGDRADAAAAAGAGRSCTRSACRTTGGRAGISTGDSANDLLGVAHGPEHAHPGDQGRHLRHPAGPPSPRAGAARASSSPTAREAGVEPGGNTVDRHGDSRRRSRRARLTSMSEPVCRRPDDRTPGWLRDDHPKRVGFFTDTSVCIGCKACEVACKEWNTLPMDDTHGLPTSPALRDVLRQHRSARRQLLAARRVHRAESGRTVRPAHGGPPAACPATPATGPPTGLPAVTDGAPRPRPARRPDAATPRRAQRRGARASSTRRRGQTGRRRARVRWLMRPTSASTARTPAASTSARPGRCSAPSSARSSCRTTSATAAATACRPARTA